MDFGTLVFGNNAGTRQPGWVLLGGLGLGSFTCLVRVSTV